jgi:hypothetical protein
LLVSEDINILNISSETKHRKHCAIDFDIRDWPLKGFQGDPASRKFAEYSPVVVEVIVVNLSLFMAAKGELNSYPSSWRLSMISNTTVDGCAYPALGVFKIDLGVAEVQSGVRSYLRFSYGSGVLDNFPGQEQVPKENAKGSYREGGAYPLGESIPSGDKRRIPTPHWFFDTLLAPFAILLVFTALMGLVFMAIDWVTDPNSKHNQRHR